MQRYGKVNSYMDLEFQMLFGVKDRGRLMCRSPHMQEYMLFACSYCGCLICQFFIIVEL